MVGKSSFGHICWPQILGGLITSPNDKPHPLTINVPQLIYIYIYICMLVLYWGLLLGGGGLFLP